MTRFSPSTFDLRCVAQSCSPLELFGASIKLIGSSPSAIRWGTDTFGSPYSCMLHVCTWTKVRRYDETCRTSLSTIRQRPRLPAQPLARPRILPRPPAHHQIAHSGSAKGAVDDFITSACPETCPFGLARSFKPSPSRRSTAHSATDDQDHKLRF